MATIQSNKPVCLVVFILGEKDRKLYVFLGGRFPTTSKALLLLLVVVVVVVVFASLDCPYIIIL